MSIDPTKLQQIASRIAEEVTTTYEPTDEQQRVKSQFWGRLTQDPSTPIPPTPNLALALRLGGNRGIENWWKQPGFPEWFWNKQEFEQKLDYVAMVALQELETTLRTRSIDQEKKIPAIRIALELSGKLRAATQAEPVDKKIAQMDRKQLEDYINNKVTKLRPIENNILTETTDPDKVS